MIICKRLAHPGDHAVFKTAEMKPIEKKIICDGKR